jgi:DNA invertase Pin-like site-specific DNA recombinase
MKVAIYVRVSKEDQHPENQILELEEYAENRGYNIYHVYVDRISGSKDSRPALNELMIDARNRKFDAVIVWKLDRLGRSLQHLIQVIQEWDNLGIQFICKTQDIDTTRPSGRLIFHIFGAIAEFEREIIKERINLGLERARKQGKHLGRPKGKKDTRQRKKSGYYQRWSKKSSPTKTVEVIR